MISTDKKGRILSEFSGCNDLVEQVKLPDDLVPFALGGEFTVDKLFKRLGGKQLYDNTTSRGAILNISPISFRDREVVIVHTTNRVTYELSTDVTVLATSGRTPNIFDSLIE